MINLEAYWSFNGDSLHDFSGNNRDLTNFINLAFADGISDKALSFVDRSVLRAAYGATINFSAKTAFSVSWWCNKTATEALYARVFCFALATVDGVTVFAPPNTNNITLRFNRASSYEDVTVANAFDATIRHYVLTFDLPTKKWILYRNGASIGDGTLTYIPVMPNRAFVLGNDNTPAISAGWIGLIDEVRLYSRVLTPTEALALYEDPGQNIPAPAPPIIPRSTDDTLLDNIVIVLAAFSAEQAAIDPTVAFNVTRDQVRPASQAQLPLVNVWLDSLTPEKGAKTWEQETATVNVDCIVRGEEGEAPSDQEAGLKLAYLKEQVKSALWALAQIDFGLAANTIARKGWPRWQFFKTENNMPEEQVVGGRWSFDVEYGWTPSEIARQALTELRITEKIKDLAPTPGVNVEFT